MDAHLSIEIDKPDRIKGHVVVGDRTVAFGLMHDGDRTYMLAGCETLWITDAREQAIAAMHAIIMRFPQMDLYVYFDDDEPFRCYEANTLGADLAERLWKRYGDYRIASMH